MLKRACKSKGILTDKMKSKVYQWYLDGHRVEAIAVCMRCSRNVIYRALREFPPIPQKSLCYYKNDIRKGKKTMSEIETEIERLELELEKKCIILNVMNEAEMLGVDADIDIDVESLTCEIEKIEEELERLYGDFDMQANYYGG